MAFHSQGQVAVPTNPLQQAMVQEQESKIILTGSGMIDTHVQPLEGIPFLQQHQFCHKWQWELTVIGNLPELMVDIQAGQGYAISDGSFQEGKGTAACLDYRRLHQQQ